MQAQLPSLSSRVPLKSSMNVLSCVESSSHGNSREMKLAVIKENVLAYKIAVVYDYCERNRVKQS